MSALVVITAADLQDTVVIGVCAPEAARQMAAEWLADVRDEFGGYEGFTILTQAVSQGRPGRVDEPRVLCDVEELIAEGV